MNHLASAPAHQATGIGTGKKKPVILKDFLRSFQRVYSCSMDSHGYKVIFEAGVWYEKIDTAITHSIFNISSIALRDC